MILTTRTEGTKFAEFTELRKVGTSKIFNRGAVPFIKVLFIIVEHLLEVNLGLLLAFSPGTFFDGFLVTVPACSELEVPPSNLGSEPLFRCKVSRIWLAYSNSQLPDLFLTVAL